MSSRKPSHWMEDPSQDDDVVEAANILMDIREGIEDEPTSSGSGSEDDSDGDEEAESSSDDEEDSGEDDSDDESDRQAPVATANISANSASSGILAHGAFWKLNEPMTQPLRYRVAANATGGERVLTYGHTVDFNSRSSVDRANKTRRQEVWRARRRFNLPLARPSFVGHQYMPAHLDWIAIAHEAYAMLHGGRRIPWNILTLWWNFCWHDAQRTEDGLRALYARNAELKAMRNGYPQ